MPPQTPSIIFLAQEMICLGKCPATAQSPLDRTTTRSERARSLRTHFEHILTLFVQYCQAEGAGWQCPVKLHFEYEHSWKVAGDGIKAPVCGIFTRRYAPGTSVRALREFKPATLFWALFLF